MTEGADVIDMPFVERLRACSSKRPLGHHEHRSVGKHLVGGNLTRQLRVVGLSNLTRANRRTVTGTTRRPSITIRRPVFLLFPPTTHIEGTDSLEAAGGGRTGG